MNSRSTVPVLLIAFCVTLPLSFAGCGREGDAIRNIHSYLACLKDEAHGLSRVKSYGSLAIRARYLPPEYMLWQELRSRPASVAHRDSLFELYRRNAYLLLRFEPSKDSPYESDIIMAGLSSQTEYDARQRELNYGLKNYVYLRADGLRYEAALTAPEHAQGMGAARSFILVFNPGDRPNALLDAETLDLVFEDRIFGTGISHFIFHGADIRSFPRLDLPEL